MNSSGSYNRAYHRFALFLALCAFLLIIAGALVTSNNAGLAVPDWPTSFGSLYRIPPMVGGIKYEHGHRMLAEFVGLLTIIFAIWTQRSEARRWMRFTAWVSFTMVIIQGGLGGLTVLHRLPWYISTLHAMVAQSLFALMVLFGLWTNAHWLQNSPARILDVPGVRTLSVVTMLCLYIQLFLGAGFRHAQMLRDTAGKQAYSGLHFWPHLAWAAITAVVITYTSWQVKRSFGTISSLRRSAAALNHLLYLQILLGTVSYFTRVSGHNAPQPMPEMIASTVAHVAVGALLLAVSWILVAEAHHQLVSPALTGESAVSA